MDSPEKDISFPSFPNADQAIPGVEDKNRPQGNVFSSQQNNQDGFSNIQKKPTVNIFDALRNEKREEAGSERIHTFQGDIASAIKNDNLSMIKVALAEKKRQEKQRLPLEIDSSNPIKKPIILAAIGIFFILALAFFTFFFMFSNEVQVPGTNQIIVQPLIYTEKKTLIDLDQKDGDDTIRILKRELDEPLDLGQINHLVLTTGVGTGTKNLETDELFTKLETNAPDSLLRSLGKNFLFGIYSFSPNDFFVLIPITSYDSAFAGMLQWEPDMEHDIGTIVITEKKLAPITDVESETGETPSSTQKTSNQSFFSKRVWVDKVIDNKDTRVLINSNGSIAMLYTFLDKDNLLIASSDKALKEISFRLTAGKIVR